jgi:hypothetical protein
MPNGEPGLPDPDRLGDDPPPYIEGPTGGPAMPTGGGGQWSKQGAADYQAEMQTMTAVTAIAGSLLVFGGGVFTLIGLTFGVIAVVTGLEVERMNDLVRDPPQPFDRIVNFQRRVSRPPGKNDPIARGLGLIVQYGVTTMVTARGLLDAVERGEGARLAGDADWAITHAGVERLAAAAMHTQFAYQAWAIAAASASLRGTPQDIKLPAGDVARLREWLSDATAMEQLRRSALDSGLTPLEIDRGLARLHSLEPLAQSVLLSEALATHGQTLYAIALKPPGQQ